MASPAHGHGGEGHGHGVAENADVKWLGLALAINAGFMLVEVVAGVLAHSLALLSDAAHMLTDAGALALALVAARLAQRAAKGAMTYGLKRAEILSAQANGLTLLILAAFIVYEAVRRLVDPPAVDAGPVLAIALAGVAVNAAAAVVLARANRQSLNVRGAFQHNLIDAYASLATATAAVVILLSGYDRADPIASVLIAVPMLRMGYGLVKASGRIFLEAAPEGVDPDAIGEAMAGVAHVREVHDLHVWEVTSGFPALSAHVLVGPGDDCHATRRELERLLHERFEIDHTTLQVEHEGGELLTIEAAEQRPGQHSRAPERRSP
jgi:cobalt-zinc-cadmium efflux system protein